MKSSSKEKQHGGVMFNAYPDSIGNRLADCIELLEEELQGCFSHFYILPTFFNSDLDRGFSIIDYDLNAELIHPSDLERLNAMDIQLKFDIVLNHLSVASPQFKDLLEKGEDSEFKDFFINWNVFWKNAGKKNDAGVLLPKPEYLSKLFMRKSGLPILKVPFPDGSEPPYWNTFYQKISYDSITPEELFTCVGAQDNLTELCIRFNTALENGTALENFDWEGVEEFKSSIRALLHQKRTYLGQMDVNAHSPKVWEFYQETLGKLAQYGGQIIRLDAFAYLHKAVGESNFFNVPGTWDYLERIRKMAEKYQLTLLPEIHAEYGSSLHAEVAEKGYMIYDFFFPGLVLHTLESKSSNALKKWIKEIVSKKYQTVNMLGCHDGIPVLDLKGKHTTEGFIEGLLSDQEIEAVMEIVLGRGGRVKNLYDAQGKKIAYYQINATFFSALGEDDTKMILARAIQMFMPGIPQVWYLDLFAGTNDYKAVERGGSGSHKEINRTNLSMEHIQKQLPKKVVQEQLKLLRFRNQSKAFEGAFQMMEGADEELILRWSHALETATLRVNLKNYTAILYHQKGKEIGQRILI